MSWRHARTRSQISGKPDPEVKRQAQPGNCRGGHTRTSRAPAVKTIPRAYRTRRCTDEMISGAAAPVRAAGQGRWPCRREACPKARLDVTIGLSESHTALRPPVMDLLPA